MIEKSSDKGSSGSIPGAIIKNRKLVLSLGLNDFRNRFAGSVFGIIWAFVQPVVTVLLFWFVFEFAMGAASQGNTPFVLWLMAGLVPWFFFSDSLCSATNVFCEYSYLVKKVVFKIEILPFVKVFSNLFVHAAFILFMFLMYGIVGVFPGASAVQVVYYSFAMICFVTSLVYLTSSICVFFRDISQMINIFMQVFMWMTPIMWNIDTLSENIPVWIVVLLKINPMFYIVQGYRDAMISGVWFTQRWMITLYFWGITLIMYLIGSHIFRKLKGQFADVL